MNKIILFLMIGLLSAKVIGQNTSNPFQNEHKKRNWLDIQSNETNASYKTDEIKHVLDSIVSENFDANTMQWTKEYKEELTYTASGNIETYLSYIYDANLNATVYSSNEMYEYDSNGNITEMLQQNWSTDLNNWVNASKAENSYSNNKLTLTIDYQWDVNVNQWVQSYKYEYTYTGELFNQQTYYSWNTISNQWEVFGKSDFSYDSNNNIELQESYSWDGVSNSFVPSYKLEYVYNGNNNLILATSRNWQNGMWLNAYKSEYTYNANNLLMVEAEYDWDDQNSQWVESWKSEYDYNVNNDLIAEIGFYYLTDSSTWVTSYKSEFTHDNLVTSDELIIPYFYQDEDLNYFNHKLLEFTQFNWNASTNSWSEPNYKSTLYYSQQDIASVQGPSRTGITIFPNPTSDYITFDKLPSNTKVDLYNASGEHVLTRSLLGSNRVNVEHLPAGNYTYRLTSLNASGSLPKTGKIVLLK